jgi:general secretion pathway protein D
MSAVEAYLAVSGKPTKDSACCHVGCATHQKELIDLVKTTIQPTRWDDQGGPCTIEFWPLTGALVVNAPPDMQEQIADLLAAVRRLCAAEVAVELRFVTMADCFYDRLKADVDLKDHKDSSPVSLDDDKVRELLEMAQREQRTSIMQAPRMTLFNGQAATLHIIDAQRFTTGVTVRWNELGLAAYPQEELIEHGLQLGIQPTLSADRKYVHLNLDIKRASLESSHPPLIPTLLVTKRDPASGQRVGCLHIYPATTKTDCASIKTKDVPGLSSEELKKLEGHEATIFTQFIQAPKFNKVSLERKLDVPEGKTAILYGWKEMIEVSDSVPVLSRLPVVGKLYQHVRREPATVLVLVTPRVLVSEESEREAVPPEVLPMPTLHARKAVKRAGGAEEQESPQNIEDLLAKYHKACAAGRLKLARKLATRALAIDPTCFDKQR